MSIWRLVFVRVLLVALVAGAFLLGREASSVWSRIPTGAKKSVAPLPEKPYAQDFTLQDLSGKAVKLSDFRGKPVILNFWATWCPPCIEETPSYRQLAAEHPELVVLGVAVDFHEDKEDVEKFVADKQIAFTVLFDEGGGVADLYDVNAVPTAFMINPDGTLGKEIIGGVNWQEHNADFDGPSLLSQFLNGKF